jgi:hypothetical protein
MPKPFPRISEPCYSLPEIFYTITKSSLTHPLSDLSSSVEEEISFLDRSINCCIGVIDMLNSTYAKINRNPIRDQEGRLINDQQ